MASRLPVVAGDLGAWGSILNDYLSQDHGSDGHHSIVITNGGSVATPALSAAGATSNGLYFPTNGVGIVTGGIEGTRLDVNGVLLVGNPTSAVDTTRGHIEAMLPTSASSPGGLIVRNPGSAGLGVGASISFYGNSAQQPSVNENQQGLTNVTWTSTTGLDARWVTGIRLDDATLTGTLTTNGTTAVVGVGTQFRSELRANVGDTILINYVPGGGVGTQTVTVTNIASNTAITITPAATQTVVGATATNVSGVRGTVTYAGVGTVGTAARQLGVAIGNGANQGSPAGLPQAPLHVFANTADNAVRIERLADTASRWDMAITSTGAFEIFNPSIGAWILVDPTTQAIQLNQSGSGGLRLGTPTGGDKGAGSINVGTSGGYYAGGSSGITKVNVSSTFTNMVITNGIITSITT